MCYINLLGEFMYIENLDIKYAIEFLKTIGYTWDGNILKDNPIRTNTIYEFHCIISATF